MTPMIKLNLLVLLFLIASGCDSPLPCSNGILSRTISPDGRVDAVIETANCGATTSDSYKIYIVRAGEYNLGNYVFHSDKTIGLAVNWLDAKKLVITYKEARIFNYKNFWQSKELENFEYIVSIEERKIK